MPTYQELESLIADWCRRRADVLAAIIIGSRGRLTPAPDDYSDLDLILFVVDSNLYTADSKWIEELGVPWITVMNHIGRGDPEWLVLFQGGMKADLLLISAEPDLTLAEWLDSLPYQQVIARGARIIFNVGASSETPVSIPPQATQAGLPSDSELEHTTGNALFTADRISKFIRRKDNWRSHTAFSELREHILLLLEWHARATFGAQHDTWYEGRYLETWADGHAVYMVRALDLGYQSSSQVETLLAALELIEWLVTGIAVHLGYPLPTAGQLEALGWLRQNIANAHD